MEEEINEAGLSDESDFEDDSIESRMSQLEERIGQIERFLAELNSEEIEEDEE